MAPPQNPTRVLEPLTRAISGPDTGQRDVTSLPGYYASNQYRNLTTLVSETHTFGPA
jgi:hypothetical protein